VRYLIIKAARIAEGLSQEELGVDVHRSTSTIKAWETPPPKGSEPATLNDVSRLLKRLKIPADVFIHGHAESDSYMVKSHHIQTMKLLDKLTPKQRKILIELMETMADS